MDAVFMRGDEINYFTARIEKIVYKVMLNNYILLLLNICVYFILFFFSDADITPTL